MIRYVRIPEPIQSRYVSWKREATYGRQSWLDRSVSSEELYYSDVEDTGTDFKVSQLQRISEATGIPVSINFIYPILNQKLALLSQVKPSMRTISLDGRAKDHAMVLDKMKHGVLYTSNANIEVENHIKDMLLSGMGLLMVVPTDFYRPGMFRISLVHVPYDEAILDINSKKKDLSDMEGFFIEKEFTVAKAWQLYGHIITQITDEAGNPVGMESFTTETWIENDITNKVAVETADWNTADRVRAREYYEKIYTKMYVVPNPETGVNEYYFAENLSEEELPLLDSAVKEVPDIYIKKYVVLGDWLIWEEVLPINDYPIKASFFEWGGRPYRSYGMVHYTKDMQKAADKVLQLMLLNGILSNNAGWTAPKGSIPEEDRRKWEDFGNNPRVIKEYNPKIYENQVLKPEREKVEPLSNFYPQVLEMMKSGIEFSTGISAILQGDASAAKVEVFSSLQQYQNAAMQRVIMSTSHINETMTDIGDLLVQYLSATLTPGDYQFFDENGNLNEMEIGKQIINEIKLNRYMVVSTPSTALPNQRLAMGSELMKVAQSSPDPLERSVLTQKAMELSDIREFEEVKEKIDMVNRLQGQVSSLQDAYDRLMETSKQMENKFINSELENRILKQLSQREKKVTELYSAVEEALKTKKSEAMKKDQQ